MKTSPYVRSVIHIVFAILWLTPLVRAQVTSTIQGRITDPSGAVIAGSSVKVTNEATGVSRTGQTAADGYYRIPDLLAGKYEVRAEQAGFKTLIRRGIELNSQAVLSLDLRSRSARSLKPSRWAARSRRSKPPNHESRRS